MIGMLPEILSNLGSCILVSELKNINRKSLCWLIIRDCSYQLLMTALNVIKHDAVHQCEIIVSRHLLDFDTVNYSKSYTL